MNLQNQEDIIKEENEFEKELREAFNEFDTNRNGTIDKEEFSSFMQKLGYRPTAHELQEMIDEVDKDKNGQIGFEEFKILMTKTIRDDSTQSSSIEAFAVFDKNKTGKIKKEDLKAILLTKGEHQIDINEVEDLLKYVEFNSNDEIIYADFVKSTLELFK